MQTLQANNNYFPALTGVRAIAAYLVFFHHFNLFSEDGFAGPLYHFLREFHVGVTLFFVLSGFLIAYRYLDMERFNFRKYMVNRIARIYPMYFLLTTLTFLVYALLYSQYRLENIISWLLNITFLKGFSERYVFSGIAQGWSLTVEEVFYLMAPLFFLLLRRNIRYLAVLPLLCIGLGAGLVFFFNHFSHLRYYEFFHSYSFMFSLTFFGRCTEFFIGIGLAYVFKNKLVRIPFKHFTWLGAAGIVLSLLLLVYCKGDAAYGVSQPSGKLVNSLILPLIGIMPFFYGLLTENTRLSALLSRDIFQLLGKSSYIFYLIHMGILSEFLERFTTNSLVLFLAANAVSIVLFKYVEEPLNNYIRKRFAGGAAPQTEKPALATS